MPSVTRNPVDAMPAERPVLSRLATELLERGYTDLALEGVLAYARDLGTLEGCIWADPEDREALDEVLEQSWPEVAADSYRWDADAWRGLPSHWRSTGEDLHVDRALYAAGVAAIVGEVELTPLDEAGEACPLDALVPPELDSGPYDPTEEDELFYAAWTAGVDSLTLDPEPFHP